MSDTEVDDMTAAEKAVIDAETNRVAAEAAAEAAKTAEATAAAEQAAKDAADAAAAEQAKQLAAAAAAAPVPQPAPAPVFPTLTVDQALAARNFATEQAELNRAWDEGDLTQAEWATKFAEIATAQATLAAQQAMAKMSAEAARAAAEQTFEQASTAFLARPENLDIATDRTRFAMFQAVVHAIDAATGSALPANELLAKANSEFRKTVAAPSAPAPADAPVRKPDLAALPPRLTDIPQAGAHSDGEGAEVGQLAALGIEDLEARFAGMSDAQIERILASTPGAGAEIKPAG